MNLRPLFFSLVLFWAFFLQNCNFENKENYASIVTQKITYSGECDSFLIFDDSLSEWRKLLPREVLTVDKNTELIIKTSGFDFFGVANEDSIYFLRKVKEICFFDFETYESGISPSIGFKKDQGSFWEGQTLDSLKLFDQRAKINFKPTNVFMERVTYQLVIRGVNEQIVTADYLFSDFLCDCVTLPMKAELWIEDRQYKRILECPEGDTIFVPMKGKGARSCCMQGSACVPEPAPKKTNSLSVEKGFILPPELATPQKKKQE